MGVPSKALHLTLARTGISRTGVLGVSATRTRDVPNIIHIVATGSVGTTNKAGGVGNLMVLPGRGGASNFRHPMLYSRGVFRFNSTVTVMTTSARRRTETTTRTIGIRVRRLPTCVGTVSTVTPSTTRVRPNVPGTFFRAGYVGNPSFS